MSRNSYSLPIRSSHFIITFALVRCPIIIAKSRWVRNGVVNVSVNDRLPSLYSMHSRIIYPAVSLARL